MPHLALPSCVCCSSEYAEMAHLVREQSRGCAYYSYSLLSHTSPFSLSSLFLCHLVLDVYRHPRYYYSHYTTDPVGLFTFFYFYFCYTPSFQVSKAWQEAKGISMLEHGPNKLQTIPQQQRGLPLRELIRGDLRLWTLKITPEVRWPQVCPYMHPFPSQHPSQHPVILPQVPLLHSTHGITSLPTLKLVHLTQETMSPPILHRCSLRTNLAQARALLTTRCFYMVAQSLHRRQSSRRPTSTRPNSQVAEVGDQNLTLTWALSPLSPLRCYLALLQPVQRNEKRGYMTDRGHGDPVFKCHDQAWAQLCKTFLA